MGYMRYDWVIAHSRPLTEEHQGREGGRIAHNYTCIPSKILENKMLLKG